MGLISRSFDFVNGTVADAEQVDTDLNKVYTLVNGNLDNANIAASAGIDGTKLADNTVPGTKILDDAITAAKLSDSAATDALRAVTTDHIRDLAVTTAKLAATAVTYAKIANAAVGSNRLKITTTGVLNGAATGTVDTGKARADFDPLNFRITAGTTGLNNLTAMVWDDTLGSGNWGVRINLGGVASINFIAAFIDKVGT